MATKPRLSPELRASRRQLILHDGLAFLFLAAVTAVLFVVTLFLFRSFSAHRIELARQYAVRGRNALQQGRPAEAIADLRTSLSYGPGDRANELLLAQALADDNRLEEANDYFLNLWDAQPGDGFINLQLARLARRRNQPQPAVDYYHASIYGNWNGDGTLHRRDVRLELASYLVDLDRLPAARAELLIASGNAPAIPALQIVLGDALLRAGDTVSALREYQQAFSEDSRSVLAYKKAGQLAYRQGDTLTRATGLPAPFGREPALPVTPTSSKMTQRLSSGTPNGCSFSIRPPPQLNTPALARLLENRSLAFRRFTACTQSLAATRSLPNSMQLLASQWAAGQIAVPRHSSAQPATETALQATINATEILTSELCGQPVGDDALLLLLAKRTN